jgi:hypothetical protein
MHAPVFERTRTGFLLVAAISFASTSALGEDQGPGVVPAPTAAPVNEANAAPMARVPPVPAKTGRFLISIAGSYAFQSLFDTPMHGADLEWVLGGDLGKVAISGDFDVGLGRTVYGLSTFTTTAGWLLEGLTGPFRFGGGTHLGYFHAVRATGGGDLGSMSIGAYARASLDLVQLNLGESSAVFLMVKASADLAGQGAALYSLQGGVGVRF